MLYKRLSLTLARNNGEQKRNYHGSNVSLDEAWALHYYQISYSYIKILSLNALVHLIPAKKVFLVQTEQNLSKEQGNMATTKGEQGSFGSF